MENDRGFEVTGGGIAIEPVKHPFIILGSHIPPQMTEEVSDLGEEVSI